MTRAKAAQICQAIKFILDREDYSEEVEEALNMAIAALKQLSLPKIIIRQGEQEPSAQLEIIRCEDCKHLQKWRSEESAKKFGQIYACARNVFNCPKPEDFCSFAERKEQ